jgi:hypothetical protein
MNENAQREKWLSCHLESEAFVVTKPSRDVAYEASRFSANGNFQSLATPRNPLRHRAVIFLDITFNTQCRRIAEFDIRNKILTSCV